MILAFGMPTTVWSCDCGYLKPACAYVGADAIFLGRVSFTNDDGSGRLNRVTRVRFDVEERFKGVATEVHQVWVDPGSFSDCYQRYDPGKRYLIFAIALSGYDAAKTPTVFYAEQCGGSRPADDFPSVDQDLAMLRAYRAGATLPRVVGHVYLYPFRGWPVLSGPALKGARVAMSGADATFTATICTTRSRTVGIPSGLIFPFAFGMYTRRTGCGR